MSAQTPVVSVLLCGFNQAPFLEQAIESVLNQTFEPFELLVIDNGSTDNSTTVIKKYTSDPRVVPLLFDTNQPVTIRLNNTIQKAQGKFISLLYADDFYLPNKLRVQVDAFQNLSEEYGVVYGPGLRENLNTGVRWQEPLIDESGMLLETLFQKGVKGGVMHPVTPLVRKKCFVTHPLNEAVFTEGEMHYLRLALAYKFYYVAEPTVVMRDHEGNRGKAYKKNLQSCIIALNLLEKDPNFPQRLKGPLARYRSELYAYFGWLGLRVMADPEWARGCYQKAWESSWVTSLTPKHLLGSALSHIPAGVVRGMNEWLSRVKKQKAVSAYRETYD